MPPIQWRCLIKEAAFFPAFEYEIKSRTPQWMHVARLAGKKRARLCRLSVQMQRNISRARWGKTSARRGKFSLFQSSAEKSRAKFPLGYQHEFLPERRVARNQPWPHLLDTTTEEFISINQGVRPSEAPFIWTDGRGRRQK